VATLKLVLLSLVLTQTLNGRTGSIRYWDPNREKFNVGLDPKRGRHEQEMFLEPAKMDFNLPEPQTKMKSMNDRAVCISVESELGPMKCALTKAIIEKMAKAEDLEQFLQDFMSSRSNNHRELHREEEERRVREENENRARAERVANMHRRLRQEKAEKPQLENFRWAYMRTEISEDEEVETNSNVFGRMYGGRGMKPVPCRGVDNGCTCSRSKWNTFSDF
jgi:hypothetical protein